MLFLLLSRGPLCGGGLWRRDGGSYCASDPDAGRALEGALQSLRYKTQPL